MPVARLLLKIRICGVPNLLGKIKVEDDDLTVLDLSKLKPVVVMAQTGFISECVCLDDLMGIIQHVTDCRTRRPLVNTRPLASRPDVKITKIILHLCQDYTLAPLVDYNWASMSQHEYSINVFHVCRATVSIQWDVLVLLGSPTSTGFCCHGPEY